MRQNTWIMLDHVGSIESRLQGLGRVAPRQGLAAKAQAFGSFGSLGKTRHTSNTRLRAMGHGDLTNETS